MKQNLLITTFMMILISFIVIPLQAKQADGIRDYTYKPKEETPSKFETRKNDRLSYHGKHAQADRHYKKGHRFNRKFHHSARVNNRGGNHHNSGSNFQKHSQRGGIVQNSTHGRWDGFHRNQSEPRSENFKGDRYSKNDRKNKMSRNHHDKDSKSHIGHRDRRSERHDRRD